jgi:hypothetical protein
MIGGIDKLIRVGVCILYILIYIYSKIIQIHIYHINILLYYIHVFCCRLPISSRSYQPWSQGPVFWTSDHLSTPMADETHCYIQWIGLRDNLQEIIDFPMFFSLKPIHWYMLFFDLGMPSCKRLDMEFFTCPPWMYDHFFYGFPGFWVFGAELTCLGTWIAIQKRLRSRGRVTTSALWHPYFCR